jgi:hypothetical protein
VSADGNAVPKHEGRPALTPAPDALRTPRYFLKGTSTSIWAVHMKSVP